VEVKAALDQHWAQAAAQLPPGATVLDIACGNGAAALAVARAGQQTAKGFRIAAIDVAAIEPAQHVKRHAELLRTIEFHANIRMEDLPFADAVFDAVISQFGFEYGEMGKVAQEVSRVLKPQGIISMLAMPASAIVVESAAKKVKQSKHLLNETKIFDVALVVVQALHNVESSGEGRDTRQYLDRFNGEVEKVMAKFANTDSDMIVAVVVAIQKVFTDRKTMDIAQQIAIINMLKKRVSDHIARTEAMMRAALGDAALAGMKRKLTESGITIQEAKPISVGTHGTVAWRVSGRK
jgi:ubiquinone/menaquinone biosynthesis C-methylase UbiE